MMSSDEQLMTVFLIYQSSAISHSDCLLHDCGNAFMQVKPFKLPSQTGIQVVSFQSLAARFHSNVHSVVHSAHS